MPNGLAELRLLTERCVDDGDDLIERHANVQRACAEHAEELGKLTDLHRRIGETLRRERERFEAYFPKQQQMPPAAAQTGQGQTRLIEGAGGRTRAAAAG